MQWFINFVVLIVLALLWLNVAMKQQMMYHKATDLNFKIAYQGRLTYMRNYITAINNYKTVVYKDNAKVWDVANKNWTNIKWLEFKFDFNWTQTWYLLIPDKNYTDKYVYSWYATKLEYINDYFIDVANEVIGSYYYSGNNQTWYVYNAIDDSQVCYFDSTKWTCE